MSMGEGGEKNSIETTVDEMLTTLTDLAAKVSELAAQTASLKPLHPLVKQLDGLPDKVTTLQAAAFEGSNQIAALSLAVTRLEKAHRGEKEPALEENIASASGPPPFRETPPLSRRDLDDDPRSQPSTARKTHCHG